jgi:hypothetical protein
MVYAQGTTPKEVVANTIARSQEVSIDFASPLPGSTPQPLQLDVTSPEVGELLVNGRSAAYGYNISNVMGMDASSLIFVVDLGDDYWVIITATSFAGGLETLKRYESSVAALVETMRYAPRSRLIVVLLICRRFIRVWLVYGCGVT